MRQSECVTQTHRLIRTAKTCSPKSDYRYTVTQRRMVLSCRRAGLANLSWKVHFFPDPILHRPTMAIRFQHFWPGRIQSYRRMWTGSGKLNRAIRYPLRRYRYKLSQTTTIQCLTLFCSPKCQVCFPCSCCTLGLQERASQRTCPWLHSFLGARTQLRVDPSRNRL